MGGGDGNLASSSLIKAGAAKAYGVGVGCATGTGGAVTTAAGAFVAIGAAVAVGRGTGVAVGCGVDVGAGVAVAAAPQATANATARNKGVNMIALGFLNQLRIMIVPPQPKLPGSISGGRRSISRSGHKL